MREPQSRETAEERDATRGEAAARGCTGRARRWSGAAALPVPRREAGPPQALPAAWRRAPRLTRPGRAQLHHLDDLLVAVQVQRPRALPGLHADPLRRRRRRFRRAPRPAPLRPARPSQPRPEAARGSRPFRQHRGPAPPRAAHSGRCSFLTADRAAPPADSPRVARLQLPACSGAAGAPRHHGGGARRTAGTAAGSTSFGVSCRGLGAAGRPGHTALWAELPPASRTRRQAGARQRGAPRGGGVHPHTQEGQEPHEAGGGGLGHWIAFRHHPLPPDQTASGQKPP